MQKMGRHIPKMSRGLYILENVWYDNQDVTITGTRSSGDRAVVSGTTCRGFDSLRVCLCFGESMEIREYKEDKYVRQFQRMALR